MHGKLLWTVFFILPLRTWIDYIIAKHTNVNPKGLLNCYFILTHIFSLMLIFLDKSVQFFFSKTKETLQEQENQNLLIV